MHESFKGLYVSVNRTKLRMARLQSSLFKECVYNDVTDFDDFPSPLWSASLSLGVGGGGLGVWEYGRARESGD